MITRSQIRRQLRSQGGIMNVVGRQKYGLGSFVRKAFGKVKDVVSDVVKSPIGKAAIIGAGAFGIPGTSFGGLFGGIGPKISGGSISSFFGKGKFNPLSALGKENMIGETTKLSSLGKILGKVGLTDAETGGLSGIGKLLGAGGLLGYFTSKGIAPEEAKQLEQDVYRGKGAGLDMIKADIQKYKSGESSEADMFDKGYNFLPERSRIRQATGGRVGLRSGGMNKRRSALNAAFDTAIEEYMSINDVDFVPIDIQEGMFNNLQKKMLGRAEGGRIKLGDGTPSPEAGSIKNESNKERAFMKLLDTEAIDKRADDKMEMINRLIEMGVDEEKVLDLLMPNRFSNDGKTNMDGSPKMEKAMGGMMNMPMGEPRQNAGGITELDYRAKGGFVPVGIKEKADDVPAMLSKNEFVMTADAVRGAGNGSIEKGAQRMYDQMKQLEGKMA